MLEHKKVLLVLSLGFGLATILLIAAAFINSRSLRTIQVKTERLLEERRPTEGLIEALDRENARLGSILIRLTVEGGTVRNPADTLSALQAVQKRIVKLAGLAPLDSKQWAQLLNATQSMQEVTKKGLADGRMTPLEIEHAIAAHVDYMSATSALLRSAYKHTNEVQGLIREQSGELAAESSWLLALCVLIGAALGGLSIYLTNDAFRRLEWRTEELARVSWHMLEGQEAAARRFSHEMHDEFGQILTATRCTIATVTPEEFVGRRGLYLDTLDQAVSAMRELSQLLRPVILDDFGLNEALRWLSDGFEDRTGIVCSYESNCDQRRFDGEAETHLFRIAQESLTNIARHSGATQAAVSLNRDQDKLTLTIEDNGRGLPPKERRKGASLGVIGMQARAHQIGGELHMGRGPLGGAMIRVLAPERRRSEDVAA